jgi:hypothetical protein
MPRTAASIISAATQIARTPLYGSQALDELNSLLRYIEETVDFSAARGQWNFFFNTNLVTSGAGNIIQTAGVPIPVDYLRVQVSGGSSGAQRSSKWYFQGVPYDMIEVDLTEFDDQVQQAGIQSYPYFWTKDFAQYQPITEITGDLTISSGPPVLTGGGVELTGGGVELTGGGVDLTFGSGSPVLITGGGADLTGGGVDLTGGGGPGTAGVASITNISPIDVGQVLTSIEVGMSIAGGIGPLSVVAPGTTISAIIGSGAALTLILTNPVPPAVSRPLAAATFLIGNPGLGLMYPPPSGAFPAMIRYQRRMPRLTQFQVNSGAYPWLSDADMALQWGLTGLLMRYANDDRENIYVGSGVGSGQGQFGQWLSKYLRLADDNANRAQTVQLDRRTFGKSFSSLKNTKTVGW